MSSNCPPQLQLSIQPNTTSFKRSFEQFGFDLGSPVDGGASGSNNGNDRNKRARSASSFSDSNESMDSSSSSQTLASTPSPSALSAHRQDGASLGVAGSVAGAGSLALPPRLPTPDIEDVEMSDYPTESRHSVASLVTQHTQHQSEERFRLSLERFNAFDSHISILRHSRPTSPLTGSAAPLPRSRLSTPPILPPLDIPGEQPRLSLTSSATPFLPQPPDLSTPLTEVLFGEEGEVEEEDSEEDEEDETAVAETSHFDDDAEIVQEFQARLSSALERLRPQSPLVPGLSLEDHGEDDHENTNDAAEAEDVHDNEPGVLTPEPPTLPPIPSDANIVHFSLEDLLSRDVPDQLSSTVAEASNSSSLVSPTLGEHPLPSPLLRDLHSWIDERQPSAESVSSSTPVTQNGPPPPPATRVLMDRRLTAVLDNYESMDGNPVDRNSLDHLRRSGQLLDNLWERRSFELWNNPTDEAEESTDYRPLSIPSRYTPSFDYSMDRRLEPSRRRVRINSSNSLVTESGLEARRRADHDEMIRPGPGQPNWWRRAADPVPSSEPSVEPDAGPSHRRSALSGRVDVPYILHLPPLPNPSLDDPSDDREEEERRVHELVTGSTSQVPRLRWYAPAASSSVRGDWVQPHDEEAQPRRSQLPSLSSASALRQRMAAASSMRPQHVRPSSPLLSPLGNLDLEFFPNGDGGEVLPSSTNENREAAPYQGQMFVRSASIHNEGRPPLSGSSNEIIHESARRQPRLSEEWQFRQNLVRQHPGAHNSDSDRLQQQLSSPGPTRSFEQRNNVEHPPSLPPPDLGTTFDGQEQVGLVAQFREQYRQRVRMSFGEDESVPSSVTANLLSRLPPSLRHIPHTTPHYSRYGAQNTPPVPSQPSMPSTSSYRPQSSSADVTPETGALDWRHQTMIRLEQNRQQLQALNERQRNLEAFFEGRAPRLEANNSTQPLASHDRDSPSSARTLLGTAGESRNINSIDLDGLNRRSLAPIPAVDANLTTAPIDVTEPSPLSVYPHYLFSEERVRDQPILPPYQSPLDPEAFAPGPFRNTMAMQQQRLNRVPSHPQPPPSIPPLPFQDTNPAYPPYTSSSQSSSDEEAPRRYSLPSTARPDPFDFGLRSRIPHASEDRNTRRTPTSTGLSSFPNYSATMNTNTTAPSDHRSSDLHRYLTQRVRMDPSRLESPSSPAQPSSSSSNAPTRTYPNASYIDPMRPSGHNSLRQLQLMQHRQHEMAERRRVALLNARSYVDGSDADLSSNTSGPPASRPFMSRFEPEGFASWRNRRRRHPGRSGGIGDFIHDDEFDDSYEGLLSLAATLGDAKPKSTPSDILENLEKGTFQHWKTHDGDKRCPICLDDYTDNDKLLKLNNCTHWLHHDCLQQWLNTANTCPVCRESVQTPGSSGFTSGLSSSSAARRPYHRLQLFRRGPPQPPPGPGGNSPSDRDGPGSHGASGGWASAFRGFE